MKKKNYNDLEGYKIFWILFTLFIFYGTLIPFNFSFRIETLSHNFFNISWHPFVDPDGTRASIPDVVQNILFFLPFGAFGFLSRSDKNRRNIVPVTILAALLSVIVELLQLMTIDRTTSVTDLITNTTGAFIGAVGTYKLYNVFSKMAVTDRFRKTVRLKYFYPLVISSTVVISGSLEPFDFTLDVGSVFFKIKSLLHNPIDLGSTLRDEGVVLFRFFLFAYVIGCFMREQERNYAVLKGILLAAISGIILEMSQVVVASRFPSAQDVFVVLVGSISGSLFTMVRIKNVKPLVWSIFIIIITGITAGIYVLSPFQIVSNYKHMNMVPFLPYYEQTTFVALSNFIESSLVYFPMGFLLELFYGNIKYVFTFSFVAVLLIALPLELSQGWINGRYPDVTDVIGSLIGALAGSLSCYKMCSNINFNS